MSHLDTAYQLGVKQAEQDFNDELQKAALEAGAPPPLNTTGKGTVPVGTLDTKPKGPAPVVPLRRPSGGVPGASVPPPTPMRR